MYKIKYSWSNLCRVEFKCVPIHFELSKIEYLISLNWKGGIKELFIKLTPKGHIKHNFLVSQSLVQLQEVDSTVQYVIEKVV